MNLTGCLLVQFACIAATAQALHATTVTLNSSPNPANYGQPVTLTATISAGATGKVTFYDGSTILGIATISGNAASLTTSALQPGSRALKAYYWGDSNNPSASAATPAAQSVVSLPSRGLRKPFVASQLGSRPVVLVADVNGDQIPDVVVGCTSNLNGIATNLCVWLGDGTGGIRERFDVETGYDWNSAVAGDWNGDGKLDLALANSNNDSITLLQGNGDGTFQAPTTIILGFLPTGIAVADFNGDGKADLAVAGSTPMQIFFGNGDGTFQTGASYTGATMAPSTSIVAGDFNGDGKPDLAVGSSVGIYVALNKGDGTFGTPVHYTAGLNPSYVTTGDFNKDGRLDIVAADQSSPGHLEVLLGNGDGTFQTALASDSAPQPFLLLVTDLNGDGIPDVVSMAGQLIELIVSLGNGDGTFQPPVFYDLAHSPFSPGVYTPYGIGVGDFNRDGTVDIVATYSVGAGINIEVFSGGAYTELQLSLTHGQGFTQGQTGAFYKMVVTNVGDLYAPGAVVVTQTIPDGFTATSIGGSDWTCILGTLTCTRSDSLFGGLSYPAIFTTVNVGSQTGIAVGSAIVSGGILSSANYATDNATVRPAVPVTLTSSPNPSTLSQNITLTAAVGSGTGKVTFYDGPDMVGVAPISAGRAVFTTNQLAGGTHSLTARFDGDSSFGPLDSAVLKQTIKPSAANGTLPVSSFTTGSTAAESITVGDFNRDGKLDLVTANASDISVLLGNGDGTFQPPTIYPFQFASIPLVAVGDLNGDGKPDLAVLLNRYGVFFVLLGNGDGTFRNVSPSSGVDANFGNDDLIIADVNHDGKADIVAAGFGSVSVFIGNGDGTFQSPIATLDVSVANRGNWSVVDMNGDGKLDIVTTVYGMISISLGNGDGTFQPATYFTNATLAFGFLVTGDFDGDGRLDVVQHYATFPPVTGGFSWFPGKGDGTLLTRVDENAASPPVGFMAAGDFNGDGKLDIVYGGAQTNPDGGYSDNISLVFGSGDGKFPDTIILAGADPCCTVALATGDFNGDGRLDVVSSNPHAATVDVYLSTQLSGYLDSATCTTISGWAADRSHANQVITVNIYDSATLLATIAANLVRSDLATALGDNGAHGFTYTIPGGLATGISHNIHVQFANSSSDLTGSPKSVTCAAPTPNYSGYLDNATCSGITGWAVDRNRLNTSITVTLWDGTTQIASTTANASRPDVGAILSDNGLHGFSIPIPSAYANGTSHTLQVRYETSATQLASSPVTLTCGNSARPLYSGYIDSASCTGINGWAADKMRLNTPITVTLWDGATQIASTTANASRGDVGSVLGDNGLHGFSIPIPSAYANGSPHTLQVWYEASSTQLPGSPITLTCGGAGYVGYIDSASCKGINGWAADTGRLNTPITVTLWDGATQIASATANASRSDVGNVLHDNGLHGFSIPIPSAYANGSSHSLQIRYETSVTQLPGSPSTLSCAPAGTNYTGWVDSSSCSAISGWVADKNHPNQYVAVDLLDGSTVVGIFNANILRSDVGGLLGDNGVHGFTFSPPASLKNGAVHNIQVRYSGTSTSVPNSPQTLQCSSASAPSYTGYVDQLSCSIIAGWAADKNTLNSTIDVQVFDGVNLLGTVTANQSRPDVGSVLGDNGLHGFTFATPASVKDGKTHTIIVRTVGSSATFAGPQSLTCQ